jgi:substrate import-associated zinc metallohydrolase lipoprotein
MKNFKKIILLFLVSFIIGSCKTETPVEEFKPNVDYFTVSNKPKPLWNELDYLCEQIYKDYGVKIIYEYSPQTIAGTTFFTPPDYTKALNYTRIVLLGFWLKPLKEKFPLYFSKETPIEFVLAGGFIHFNDITTAGAAAGAGMNAQFYRLGMGGVNNFDKANKAWLFDHIVTLYHEHAHQQDHKYGRGFDFDRISVGTYYGSSYSSKSLATANADGFTTAYGGYAPEEDFATTVENIARSTKANVDILLTKNPKLVTKYRYIDNFYSTRGMDLYKLHDVLDSVVYRTNY